MRNKGFFRITLLAAFFVVAVSASTSSAINSDPTNCPTVDIRKLINLGDTRDQKSLGWCYAYGSSDLFTARFAHPVSSLDIALLVARYRAQKFGYTQSRLVDVHGGSFADVLNAINNFGFCSEYRFSANDPRAAEVIAVAEDLANSISEGRKANAITDEHIAVLVTSEFSLLQRIFPEVKLEKLIQIYQAVGTERFPIVNVVAKVCGGRTRAQKVFAAGSVAPDRMELAKRVLTSGQPIYIRWAEKTLENLDLPIGPPGHGSSLVAMRFDRANQQCEFLIRNSYGADIKNSLDPRIREDVEGGNIWVSQDLAERMIYSIHWLR